MRRRHYMTIKLNDEEWDLLHRARLAQQHLSEQDSFEQPHLIAAQVARDALMKHCQRVVNLASTVGRE